MTQEKAGNYGINVPDIGEGIAEVELVEWSVKTGDEISEDDVICAVMTDKATVEIPSPVDGTVAWTGVEEGEMVAVGKEFVRLQVVVDIDKTTEDSIAEADGESSANTKNARPKRNQVIEAQAVTKDLQPEQSEQSQSEDKRAGKSGMPRPEGEKPVASPAVRHRAREAGIDLRQVRGTGPANRISHGDLDNYISGGGNFGTGSFARSARTSVEEIRVIGLRRKIATVMQDTKQRIPHFTYVEEIDVTALEALRVELNAKYRDKRIKLTLLPLFIRAFVNALKSFPEMSSRFDDVKNVVQRYAAAHIGIATQTANGLLVPVIRHAETLDIWEAASEIKRLSTAARSGTASPDELSGSTVTITSLGRFGGIVTTPVINSPEVAILGINRICKRPVWQEGAFLPRDIMNLSASFDHRIIDGWEAALFVHCMKDFLESPATLFLED